MFKKTLCRAAFGLALSASFGAVASAQNADIASFATGANYFSAGAFAEAGAAFDRAIASESDDPRVYYFRGLCSARQNDLTSAAEYYALGANLEVSTEKGRLTDVNGALAAIQGAERAPIEAARKAARDAWKAAEARRQQTVYGESLDRQRARLAVAPKAAGERADANDALAVAPIRPYSRAEVAARQVPNLYDKSSDEFKYFREDLGKTGVSTKTKARMAELAARVVYDDPMDKPAADGSPFINIYAESEIFVDDEAFVGEDDPDTIYKEDEENLLNAIAEGCQVASQALSARLGGATEQDARNSAYPGSSYPGPGAPYSSGDPSGSSKGAAQAVAPSASDDTKLLFEDSASASPFGEKAAFDKENDFEQLFSADREFKPAAPAASATGSGYGPSAGPGMGVSGGPGVSDK